MAEIELKDLPLVIPVFPLPGALLFPGQDLPLNIFEPRYLDMTRDAASGCGLIGMIQPIPADCSDYEPKMFQVGCVGQMTQCQPTADGRYLINLRGICRFRVIDEITDHRRTTKYRQIEADFDAFGQDLMPSDGQCGETHRFHEVLRAYLDATNLPADWKSIEAAPLAGLVDALAMVLPFDLSEKQALLEAVDAPARKELMIGLMELEMLQSAQSTGHIQ